MRSRRISPPASVLPASAARLLQQAAQVPITQDDPLARVKAIERAIERVKRGYPQFFRQESDDHETQAR